MHLNWRKFLILASVLLGVLCVNNWAHARALPTYMWLVVGVGGINCSVMYYLWVEVAERLRHAHEVNKHLMREVKRDITEQ